jgi:hypothetical protein
MRTQADSGTLEDRLQSLMTRGFQFVHPRGADGALVAVVGVRAHDDVIDVVRLNAEDDAEAMRIPGDEPDVLAPSTRLWSRSGDTFTVLDQLLGLPERTRGKLTAPSRGCWIPTSPGQAKWLAAS